MLYRRAYEKLREWKESDKKKALCIFGARQIGKTTIIRHFGAENYENMVEINFVTDKDAAKIFDGPLDADTIITNLTAYVRKPMEPGKTLIFFDEVQECPDVRTAIKFLVEDSRFDYIESGSLLGVKYKEIRSYPVGYEDIYRMYPMDFEEFLIANGVQEQTLAYLKDCFDNLSPVSDSVHDTLNRLFMSYIVVGGMPETVQIYVDTHDIGKVIENQNSILDLYRLDIARYADGNNKVKIKAIFDSIPSQLNDRNRRFILTDVDGHGRHNRYANSFNWLDDSGTALPCYNVTEPRPPLKLNEKHNLFKLFMNDTGLLCAACMENIQFDILNGDLSINMGSVLENVMAQQLAANGFSLYYFDAKKYGEVDFVVQKGLKVDLVEIKSGKDYKVHASLNKVRRGSQWQTGQSYVFCRGNIEKEDGVIYLPWYEIMFLKPDQPPKNLTYEVDISGLEI